MKTKQSRTIAAIHLLSAWLGLAAWLGWGAAPVSAILAINFNGESGNAGAVFANGVGTVFTVGSQNLVVTNLGATGWCSDWNNTTHSSANLNASPVTVKLWRVSDGALLASATLNSANWSQTWFPSGAAYMMPYLTAPANVLLTSNVQHIIALYGTGNANLQYINSLDTAAIKPVVATSYITFNDNRRASAGGYIMLDTSDGGTSVRYGGPTFEFTTPATQYFSGTSATAWDTTTTDWGTTSGGAYNVVWGGPFNTAVFEGTPNIVTMGAAMNAAAVTLNVSGYVFDTAAFNPTWGPVGGSGSLTKAGSGTLSLSSSNSYSGATTISNGTLNLASAASTTAKTTAGGGNSTYGGSLGYNFTVGANPIYITKLGFWDQGQNGLGASHVVNISTTGGSLVASATVTTAEPLSGEYRFVTLGTPVQLAANTTYRIWSQGYTIDAYNPGASAGVDAGVTGVTFATGSFYKDAGGMPDSADTTVYRTTTFAFALSLASLPPATALNVAGSGATCNLSGLNATVGSLAGVTGSSLLLGAGLLTVGDATSTSFAGLISGTGGSLVKNGNGTFTLSSSNGYTGGTTIRSGAVNVQNGYGLGTAGSVVVSNAAELQLQGGLTTPALALSLNGTGTNSSGALRNISGGNTYAGAITLAGPTRINSDADSLSLSGALAAGAYTLAFGGAGDINMNNSISGTAGLTKDGAGTLSLNGNYGGPVTVNSGTMALVGNYNRLMASPSITVNNGATLTCPSYAQNFNQLHLTGGTLAGTGDGTYGSWLIGTNVIVNGGTNTSTISATAVTIKTPGVVFNVSPGAISGIDLDVPGTIVHIAVNPDNSLIKAGAGVMRLSGNNTYLASTIVSNGTLALSGSGSIASSASIVVNAGAVLDASARTDGTLTLGGAQTLLGVGVVKGTVTVGAGSSLSPATNGVVGTLNFSNQLNLTGGSSYYDLANVTDVGANDRMVVAGDLNLTGTNRIFVNKLQGVLTTGSYPLFTYGGALNGGATNFQLIGAGGGLSRQTVSIDTSVNNVVALNVVGSVGSLLWTAANGNVWDIVTTTNWINLNQAGAPDVFYDTDFVAFDDSAATGNVSVGVPVLVDLLAINNTNLAYTFSGAGKIGGKAGLNKSGPGALNITLAANDFAGTNYLNGGTVTVSALASNGLPSSLGTNANIVFNGGSLNYTGPSLNINRTLALNSGATLGVADSAAKLTVNSALTGNGGLTKAGLGTLALSQLNTYTGGTVVEAGTLELNKMFNSDTAMLSPTTNLVVKNSGTVRFTGTNYNVLGARAGRITDLTVEAGGLVSADSTTNNGHHLLHPILKGGTLAAANTNHNGFGNFILYTNNLVTATADEASTISADLGLSMPAVFDVADGPAPADLTISGAVLTTPDAIAPGGIVKSNTGTLLLTGASRYAGATTVGAGTLALGAGGAISNSAIITVASGAAIDVSAVNGGFNLNTNQTLAGSGVVLGHVTANSNSAILPGGSLVAGTLSLSNNLVLNTGSKLNFDLANSAVPSASDLLVVGGDLVLAGVATINISRPDIFLVEGGHYTIIRYSGALVGDVPSSFLITPDFTRYNPAYPVA